MTPTGPIDSKAQGRFLIDGVVKGSAVSVDDDWDAKGSFDIYVADEGETPVLSIEIRRNQSVGGNDTVEIRKMKLLIERMG